MAEQWLGELGFTDVIQDEDTGIWFDKRSGRYILFSPLTDTNTPGEMFLAPRGRNPARYMARGFSPRPFPAADVKAALEATAARKAEENRKALLEEARRAIGEEKRLDAAKAALREAEAEAKADMEAAAKTAARGRKAK